MDIPVQITRLKKTEFYPMIGRLDELRDSRILPPQLPLHELSVRAADSILTDRSAPVPDCQTCGACCAFALIVTVTPEESEPLDNYWDITLDGVEQDITINRVLPRSMETGHCVFLDGNIGEAIGCGIYEARPHVCRDFEAGSDKCRAYRRMYGIEPQLTDDEIAAAIAKFGTRPAPQKISFVGIVKDADFSFHDMEGAVISTGIKLRIVAFLDEDGETEHDLHTYDPAKETWFENEFLTLTLSEAKQLIVSKLEQATMS